MANHKRLEKLMLFNEVASLLSFSKAAESLNVSKSYLSEKIKSLETELATPLIIRTTRSVRLTLEGERVFAQTQQIKHQVTELDRLITLQSSDISGILRLTAPKMFSESILIQLCAEFRKAYPDITFEINSSYEVFNISDTEVDFAFRATKNPPDNLVALHLIDYEHCLVASPNYLSQRPPIESIDDLILEECLAAFHQTDWPLKSRDLQTQSWIRSNQNQLLKNAALNHQGVIRIADYFVAKELESGALIQVLEDETSEESGSIYLLYPQLIYPSAKAQAFIQFVKQYFAEQSPKTPTTA